MKVIIPVTNNQDLKEEVAYSFHNSEYVCVFNAEEKTYEWLNTNEISEKTGNLSVELKRKGIYTVISNQMPLMALGLFIESGIKVLKAKSVSLKENIELYLNNKLQPMPFGYSPDYVGCSTSCSSCKSSCN